MTRRGPLALRPIAQRRIAPEPTPDKTTHEPLTSARTACHPFLSAWGGVGVRAAPRLGGGARRVRGRRDQQHLGRTPAEALFEDEEGGVSWASCSEAGLLTLNYVDCPQLCSMQLTSSRRRWGMDLSLGVDHRVITSASSRGHPGAARGDGALRGLPRPPRMRGIERDAPPRPAGPSCVARARTSTASRTVGSATRLPEGGEDSHQATILCSPAESSRATARRQRRSRHPRLSLSTRGRGRSARSRAPSSTASSTTRHGQYTPGSGASGRRH